MGIVETIAGWFLKAYQASPRLMVVLALSTGALLFMPDRVLATFAVAPIVAHYRPWIALCFLFSSIMTLSYPVNDGWRSINRRVLEIRLRSKGKRRLHILDNREKETLASYITRNTRTLHFDSNNAAMANLVLIGVLYHPVRVAPVNNVPTAIHEWAWEYLHEHPELVSLKK